MSKEVGEWQQVYWETEPWETTQKIETIEWKGRSEGRKFHIPLDCYVSDGALSPDAKPVVVFPGYGEEEKAIRAAGRALDSIGIPSICVNLADRWITSREGLERSIREAPQAAVVGINEMLGRSSETPVDVIGHSKGGGLLLLAGVEAPELFGAFAVISPIGVTNRFLGDTQKQKERAYFRRLGVDNNRQPDLSVFRDPSNILAGIEVGKRLLVDKIRGVLSDKFDLAFNFDLAENIALIAEDHSLKLYLGKGDQLFKLEEYRQSIDEETYQKVVEEIVGSHTPLVNRLGRAHVRRAGEWIQTTRVDSGQISAEDAYRQRLEAHGIYLP